MNTGRLQIQVYGVTIGYPIPGATVLIQSENGEQVAELVTDSGGFTETVALAAPPLDYSMESGAPAPYSQYRVVVQVGGETRAQIEGVQVFPNSSCVQTAVIMPGTAQTEVIPPPVLYGEYPVKVPEEELKTLPSAKGLMVLPDPVIPEYVIVHLGAPTDASAQNYWIYFKDYIKNVASSEIYCTWPKETIRANVLAILSFTLNRVYTEWYRGKGYDFTITNSTAFDQAFQPNRTIYDEISVVVDELFCTYVTRDGIRQPLFTQYCDGRRSSCPGHLSQWGSKDLGDRSYTAMEILKHYFGQEIYLMEAKWVEGVPSSYPGVILQMGAAGAPVRTVQEHLNAISNNYPAISKVAVDGIYGEGTRHGVEIFQSVFRLPVTGIVDFATWFRLSDIYVAVSKLAELTS